VPGPRGAEEAEDPHPGHGETGHHDQDAATRHPEERGVMLTVDCRLVCPDPTAKAALQATVT
jgi:hypothetical protein